VAHVGRYLWWERKHLLNKQKKSKKMPKLEIFLMLLLETSAGYKNPLKRKSLKRLRLLKSRP
jgi:hypothetical protein